MSSLVRHGSSGFISQRSWRTSPRPPRFGDIWRRASFHRGNAPPIKCRLSTGAESLNFCSAKDFMGPPRASSDPERVCVTHSRIRMLQIASLDPPVAARCDFADAADYAQFPDGRIGSNPSRRPIDAGRASMDAAFRRYSQDYPHLSAAEARLAAARRASAGRASIGVNQRIGAQHSSAMITNDIPFDAHAAAVCTKLRASRPCGRRFELAIRARRVTHLVLLSSRM